MRSFIAHKQVRTPIGVAHLAVSKKGVAILSFRSSPSVVGAAFRRPNKPSDPPSAEKRGPSNKLDSRFSSKQSGGPAVVFGGRGNDKKVADRWLRLTAKALRKYFKGDARPFGKIPLDIKGTPFQKKVWRVLKRIPPGKALSYAEVAKRIGRPRAFRAVGNACGQNPVALIVPCHRVVGSGNALGGYAGGVKVKKKLLLHESKFHKCSLASVFARRHVAPTKPACQSLAGRQSTST